jgi:hypothetical protein
MVEVIFEVYTIHCCKVTDGGQGVKFEFENIGDLSLTRHVFGK